ncbi:MAG TPA: hypothetical protein VHR15_09495 [Ktedonobacterales bacterium]|nr:hypothetical protein [Ktedonobacterales bacterium]
MTAPRYSRQVAGAFCALLLSALLAACASVSITPGGDATGTPSPDVTATAHGQTPTPAPASGCQPRVTTAAPVPPSPAPKPIVPQGAASYTNTTAGYSIKYPSNWYVSDATPTGGFQILNYTPPNPGTEISPPPYNAVRIDYLENPSHLTPEAYHTANPPYSFREIGALACWETLSRTQVGGHTAYALVVWSADYTDGGKTQIYRPGIRHYITAGAYLLRVDELYSEGAKPSAALRQVITSMTFTA